MKETDIFKALERTCLRCGESWTKRAPGEPLRCARCGSKYWNKPRKNKPGAGRPKKWS